VKPEQRLLVLHRCPQGLWLVLVYRGPGRLEHIQAAPGEAREVLEAVRRQSFYEELRAAWPPEAARALGLEALDPRRYLGPCSPGLHVLLDRLCAGLEALTQHQPGPRG
jgi:hypothetical protein